jgi:prephenate dehydrogenase
MTPARDPARVSVVGVGLIGGSVALAARERCSAHVTGWDPAPGAAAAVCDVVADDLGSAVAEAELVVVAAPVDALAGVIESVLAACPEEAVVTDVGSTKQAVCEAIDDPRFIGGHPMAGGERAGSGSARSDLFAGATWYLTPSARTEGIRLERLTRFLTSLGGRPQAIEPAAHDRLMAAVSHLPHLLANLLVEAAGEGVVSAGPSFRDATRVAGANPPLWRSIYLSNRVALGAAVDEAAARLLEVRRWLEEDDGEALERWQEDAGRRRTSLDVAITGEEVREVRAVLPNRPGVLADLALALGRERINIHDLSLSPSQDNSSGEVVVWVAAGMADRAAELIQELLAS